MVEINYCKDREFSCEFDTHSMKYLPTSSTMCTYLNGGNFFYTYLTPNLTGRSSDRLSPYNQFQQMKTVEVYLTRNMHNHITIPQAVKHFSMSPAAQKQIGIALYFWRTLLRKKIL